MKQVLLSVPRNGYITETRMVEIPRETAAYVLTSPAHRQFTRAVRHKKTVSLYRHVAIYPKCGREVQAFRNGNALRYTDTEIELWALGQQSALSDSFPEELEFQPPLQTCDDIYAAAVMPRDYTEAGMILAGLKDATERCVDNVTPPPTLKKQKPQMGFC